MSKTYFTLAALITILVGLSIRCYDLTTDPPALFGGGGQDLTTDAAYLTLHARNAALFDSFDSFGFERWPAFKVSLVTGVTYLLFLLFGVSSQIAALTGILLQALAMFLFWLGVKPFLSREGQLWFLLFSCLSWVLVVFARLPFSENALLALTAATLLIYLRIPGIVSLILTGIAVALTGLLGKSFGYLLILGVMWDIAATNKGWKEQSKSMALAAGSCAATVFLFSALFHGGSSVLDFLWQHSAGQHGIPHGLSSPLGYIENLISFSRTGFHQYIPVIGTLVWLTLTARLIASSQRPLDRLDRLMLGWILAWVIVLSVFNYLPVRYLMPLFIPMSILVARWLSDTPVEGKSALRISYPKIGLLLILNWYAAYNILQPIIVDSNDIQQHFRAVWIGAAVGLVLTGLVVVIRKQMNNWLVVRSRLMLILVLVLFLGVESIRIVSWFGSRTHTIAYAAEDVPQLVSASAVLSGQYGPTVAFNSELRVFPHFFGANPGEDMAMLQKYPITHVVISNADLERFQRTSPVFGSAEVVASFWLRDNAVSLVRVNDLTGNRGARSYQLSDFERCVEYRYRKISDSAYLALERFRTHFPTNRSALLEQYYILTEWDRIRECRPLIDTLTEQYPDDFTVAILGAVYYRWLANETGDRHVLDRAEAMFASAVAANPANRENLDMIYRTYTPRLLTAPVRVRKR